MFILQVTAMWFGVTAHRLGDPIFYRLNLYRKTIPHERPVSCAGSEPNSPSKCSYEMKVDAAPREERFEQIHLTRSQERPSGHSLFGDLGLHFFHPAAAPP